MRLELVDDLHRPHLRRPGERPGRKHRAQRVHRRDPVAQRARDLADDVEDVRVGLDHHQLVDARPSRTRRPGRGRCGRGRPASRARRAPSGRASSSSAWRRSSSSLGAARIGAGDRARLDPAPGDLDQRLGRGAGELEVAEVEEVHVRRGVDGAQAAVDRERLDRRRRREALRGHHLEGVAGVDVLDDPRDVRLELAPGSCWTSNSRRSAVRRGRAARGHRAAQALARLGDRSHGARVGRSTSVAPSTKA